ncbi:polymorphic toxin type 47 domain-containing protein [Paenactinomyces guangxiensis]|uniref:Bacterial toxin 47 domain-containing protein n=1 Tax=Paenactinomyces guangxiensis TaxID=1490290 RepID=A0A7W1WUK5_9BACL|nr:polymorphic toxin type 47 domain-containing protein [Paenactinomyces guangxiensis]MBA4496330.1 hypothetical protein [Paenactinomyces guangxiensis]MBH8590859.1 hypothetical protein [Paenactinomyces guangxiensis]
MIKRILLLLFKLLICLTVLSCSFVGQSYADPGGSFEVPEVNDDFDKGSPHRNTQPKKEEDQSFRFSDVFIWLGIAENEKEADRTLSAVVDCIPIASTIKSIIDLASGKDSISGDELDAFDYVVSILGIIPYVKIVKLFKGPLKNAWGFIEGFYNSSKKKIVGFLEEVYNDGKNLLKEINRKIDDLAAQLDFSPKLQPAGGPSHIPQKPGVNKIEGKNNGGTKGTDNTELGSVTGYKFKKGVDLDFRGTGKTYKDALDEAFKRTGVPREDFIVTKWGKDANGKSFPVEWRAKNGAEVNIDTGHTKNGPDVPHVGYQTGGKRGSGGAVRGHILVDSVPVNR